MHSRVFGTFLIAVLPLPMSDIRMFEFKEMEKVPFCKYADCSHIIDFCTRDNPCPACGSCLFAAEYEARKYHEK